MAKRTPMEPHVKQRIWKAQNEKCAYCGRRKKEKYMTIDHIIPLSRGGTDAEDNLQCVCKMCNRLKDNMLPDEFAQHAFTIFVNSVKIWLSIRKAV